MKYLAALLLLLLPSTAQAVMFGSLVPVDFKSLEPIETKSGKPEVIFYTSDNCPACVELKSQLSCVPQIKFVEKPAEDWVTSLPVLHWQGDNEKWWSMGNNGEGVDLQDFVAQYKTTNPSQIKVAFDVLEAKDIGYPIRGNYWSVGSNWNPSRSQVIYHLQYGGQHTGKFTRGYLDQLSLNELQSLHSDDHESRVKWASVEKKKSAPKPQITQNRIHVQNYSKPRRRFFRRQSYSRGCPTGSCPL